MSIDSNWSTADERRLPSGSGVRRLHLIERREALSVVGHLGVLSLEPWDEVWRRNQYLASRLVRSGAVERLTFVGPPRGGLSPRAHRWVPEPGIEAVVPPLVVPRSWPGGYRVLGRWLRRALAGVDAMWINDAGAGLSALRSGVPAVHDVTDDWRSMAQSEVDRARTVHAEDVLAARATTVVCSQVLAQRWRERYGVQATLIRNGVDLDAIRMAMPRHLDGAGPHAVYVGTLHENRIDLPLLHDLAARWPGTVHLVGPVALSVATSSLLRRDGVQVHGPVPGPEVPSWLAAADVLVCPHVVDAFTLSLDAIKAHEYLATASPVVATPSCGFQDEQADGLTVTGRDAFVDAAVGLIGTGPFRRDAAVDWAVRAADFARVLGGSRPADRA